MRLRIEIRTPKGYATDTARKLQPFILGSHKLENHEVFANKANDTIIWIVETEIRRALIIQRNVTLFDKTTQSILKSKVVQGMAKLSREDKLQLEDMLSHQTKIKVIKSFDEMPNLKDMERVP